MDTTAIVLAGGLGTRLRSVVRDRPKVLATVAGRPFATYLLDQLEDAGIRQVILSTGYLADVFDEVLGHQYGAVELEYVHEGSPLGTGGAIKWAGRHVTTTHALVLNGDSYLGTDLGQYLDWHRRKENDVSLLLVQVLDASRYGTVLLGHEGRVTAFLEKRPEKIPGLINAGIYAFRSEFFCKIPEGRCSLESDVLPEWIAAHRVRGFATDAPFIDIGTPEDYRRSHQFLERSRRE